MQNNLGTAPSTLGERESGTARLEEAVSAFRDALQEGTREVAKFLNFGAPGRPARSRECSLLQ
jgi:hypothetical protein